MGEGGSDWAPARAAARRAMTVWLRVFMIGRVLCRRKSELFGVADTIVKPITLEQETVSFAHPVFGGDRFIALVESSIHASTPGSDSYPRDQPTGLVCCTIPSWHSSRHLESFPWGWVQYPQSIKVLAKHEKNGLPQLTNGISSIVIGQLPA